MLSGSRFLNILRSEYRNVIVGDLCTLSITRMVSHTTMRSYSVIMDYLSDFSLNINNKIRIISGV